MGKSIIMDRTSISPPIIVSDKNLTLEQIIKVSRFGAAINISNEEKIIDRMNASHDFIMQAVAQEKSIYGVTTAFGGMAHVMLSQTEAEEIQNNAIYQFKCGAGKPLPKRDIRAAMLLRIHSHLHGASGVRPELVRRLQLFLNAGMTPAVPEFGSIGASGDIVPLAYICGAIMGLDEKYIIDHNGEQIGAITALDRLGLEPLRLRPKEGLAMFNGTSVMTGIAINCLCDAQTLFSLTMGCHALFVQAFGGTNQSFHPFIHRLKPHVGQLSIADQMLQMLHGSRMSLDELNESAHRPQDGLIQDRYALRCIPQYLGPILEGLFQIAKHLEIEANSANDNPLIDVEQQTAYHGGNFLGQYIGIDMDHLRYYFGLLAKHLDVQIGWLVSPEFNNGLPECLIGNRERSVNLGLKGLQIVGNSIMPLLSFFGNSLADRFPTHAEQFNQNINSQGFGSANLTRQSIEMFHQYIAISLIFGVQGVDLRTHQLEGHFDATAMLSPATKAIYDAVRNVTGVPPRRDKPFIWNDDEQFLDEYVALIASNIAEDGEIVASIAPFSESLFCTEGMHV